MTSYFYVLNLKAITFCATVNLKQLILALFSIYLWLMSLIACLYEGLDSAFKMASPVGNTISLTVCTCSEKKNLQAPRDL